MHAFNEKSDHKIILHIGHQEIFSKPSSYGYAQTAKYRTPICLLPMDKEQAKHIAKVLGKKRELYGNVLWKPTGLKVGTPLKYGYGGVGVKASEYIITGKEVRLELSLKPGEEPIVSIQLDKQQNEQDLKDEILIPKQKAEVEPLTPRKLILLFHALSDRQIDNETTMMLIRLEDPHFLERFKPKNEFERSEMEEKKAKAIAYKAKEFRLEMEKSVTNKEYILSSSISASFGEYDFKKGGFPINYDLFPFNSFTVKGQKFFLISSIGYDRLMFEIPANRIEEFFRFYRASASIVYTALISPENFENYSFSFLDMHIDKSKEFVEENPNRQVKMKVYWKPMYSQELIGKEVVGKITRVEIYSSKGELIKVLAEGGVVTKQMDTIEQPEGGAEQTVSRWPWEQKGDEATPTHTPQPYTGKVYASKGSRTFHRPDCTEISNIKESELISFSSPQKALEAGGIPCDTCKPKSEVTERKTKKEPSTEPFEELIEGLKGIFGGKRR